MKTTLFAAALVVTFTLSALAAQKPSQHLAGNPNAQPSAAISVPPPACDPCIFYGGDFDPSSPNSAGLSDENTLFIPGSSTYGNFNIPTGFTVTVTGILVNVQADAAFDPQVASYDVRQGVTEGDGGTDLATGTANATVASTGRSFLGLQEYTVAVNLATPLVLGPGNYWFNVTPECQNGATDGSCSVGRMFASNTAGGRTNSIHGAGETNHEIFLNSSFFGFTWANWCDSSLGLNGQQCNGLSFGVMGTSTP